MIAQLEDEHFVIAKDLTGVLGEEIVIKESVKGKDLEGIHYEPPFGKSLFDELSDALHSVVLADYVTTEDGTGIVHQSPAFGAEDLQVCRKYGLPVVNPVQADGHFLPNTPLVAGLFLRKQTKR